jgi:hypothetical protein
MTASERLINPSQHPSLPCYRGYRRYAHDPDDAVISAAISAHIGLSMTRRNIVNR